MRPQQLLDEALKRVAGNLCLRVGQGSGGGFAACSATGAEGVLATATGDVVPTPAKRFEDFEAKDAIFAALQLMLGKRSVVNPELVSVTGSASGTSVRVDLPAWKRTSETTNDLDKTGLHISTDLLRTPEDVRSTAHRVANIMREMLENHPAHAPNVTAVRFHGAANPDDPFWAAQYNVTNFVSAASASTDDGIITFYPSRSFDLSTDRQTMAHEIGHITTLGWSTGLLSTGDFIAHTLFDSWRKQEGDKPGPDGAVSNPSLIDYVRRRRPNSEAEQNELAAKIQKTFKAQAAKRAFIDANQRSAKARWGDEWRSKDRSSSFGGVTSYASTRWEEDAAEWYSLASTKVSSEENAPFIVRRALAPKTALEARILAHEQSRLDGMSQRERERYEVPDHVQDRIDALEAMTGRGGVRASFLRDMRKWFRDPRSVDKFFEQEAAMRDKPKAESLLEAAVSAVLADRDPSDDLCLSRPDLCYGARRERRFDMPQLPNGKLPAFERFVQERGYRVIEFAIEPALLSAGQRELSAEKTAAVAREIRAGKAMPLVLVAGDRRVIDGHHRWAGRLAVAPKDKWPVAMVDADFDTAVNLLRTFLVSIDDPSTRPTAQAPQPVGMPDDPHIVPRMTATMSPWGSSATMPEKVAAFLQPKQSAPLRKVGGLATAKHPLAPQVAGLLEDAGLAVLRA